MMPSPLHYNNTQMATRVGKKATGQSENRMSKFGYGRDRMQKLHIDAIYDRGFRKEVDSNPGPGQHNLDKKWIVPEDTSKSKTTPQYSFSKAPKGDMNHFNRQVQKWAETPGPGAYSTPIQVEELDLHQPSISHQQSRYSKTISRGKRNQSYAATTN